MKHANNSLELEQRVLENLMGIGESDNIAVQQAMLKLNTDCFFHYFNKKLFALIRDEFKKGHGINFVDIMMLIPKSDTELFEAHKWILDNYMSFRDSAARLEGDVEKLIMFTMLRKQLSLCENAIEEVNNCQDAYEAQQILMDKVTQIGNLNFRQEKHGLTNIELAEDYYDGKLEEDVIIPTACEQFNDVLGGGIRSKMLITIGGKPSHGKTGFAIYLMDAIASMQLDKQSLFFSLEMESKHIWMRHVGIKGGKVFSKLSFQEREKAIMATIPSKLTIYDCASCPSASNLEFILTTARLKAMEQPLSVVVVDYLALVDSNAHFERHDLLQAHISTQLAKLAMSLDCTVILLTQVNRASAQRAKDDQCPYPSDAANGSGSENSSSLWIGIDRPEIYREEPEFKNQFVVKGRKNRFGDNFTLIYAFNGGTFGKVLPGYFKKPYKEIISPEEALFSAHS